MQKSHSDNIYWFGPDSDDDEESDGDSGGDSGDDSGDDGSSDDPGYFADGIILIQDSLA